MSPYNFLKSNPVKALIAIELFFAGIIHADLQIGGNYTHANIKVSGQPSFQGNLGGVQGSYEYQKKNAFYGSLGLSWKQGKTENSFSDRKLTYIDTQEKIGYTYASHYNDRSLTFFSGFGYRYLSHKLKQSRESSVKFDYNEIYIPVGFLSRYSFCSYWSLGFNFTWMPQAYPTVKISPLKGARWILKNTIGNMFMELPLTYFLTKNKCYSIIFNPFYERWEDGRSTAVASNGQKLGLPGNLYNFWGAELNASFSF